MKLIFVSPTYGPADPQAIKSQRVAIMHAAANGHAWVGDASPDRMKFDVARNAAAREAADSEADAVFWCDSDIVLPSWAITRLAYHGRDFITGVYFQRHDPHWPLVANFNGTSFQWIVKWEPDVLAPVDGCGFGCVITSTRMLRDIDNNWFTYHKYSEDFDFCLKAREKGYQLWVDTGVLCGHLADPKGVSFDDYQQVHPELFGGMENGGKIRSGNALRDMGVREAEEERPGSFPAAQVQLG